MNYPAFDPQWKSYGRIESLEVRGAQLVITLQSQAVLKVVYQPEYEKFKKDDWVAVDQKDRLILVAEALAPGLFSEPNEFIKKWSQYFFYVHEYFQSQNFLLISTPSLVKCPGTEPSLQPFETQLKNGSQAKTRYLPTSPEIHLKKTLTLGYERIYEVAKCYRNSEITNLHQPEFWLLEWYRSFASLETLQTDLIQLIGFLKEKLPCQGPSQVRCYSVSSLFKKYCDADLKPDWLRSDYQNLANQLGLKTNETYTIDDLFFLIMLEKIEPHFPKNELIFVENYPPFQAALARISPDGWARRFEAYWQGMELINAFDELNDPHLQRQQSQNDLKKRTDGLDIKLDEDFFKALDSGMPPSVGAALGIERLFMAMFGVEKIQNVRLFPIKTY